MNSLKNLDQIRARATARIEDIDALVGQSIYEFEFFSKYLIYASDHVLHDFGWGIPHPQLFAEFGIESL